MNALLSVANKVLIVLGVIVVLFVSAIIVDITIGSNIAIFEGTYDGKRVKGVGVINPTPKERESAASGV